MPKKKQSKRGRPQYIVSEADKKAVYLLAKKGCNEIEIAKVLGISQKTFQRNKDQFSPLVKKGRKEGTPKNIKDVENALLKICKGYEYIETSKETRETVKDTYVIERSTTKQVAPNVTAIIFFLCNRSPNTWKNVQHIDHSGSMETTVNVYVKKLEAENGDDS